MDYKDGNLWLMQGDCLERMKEIPDGSVDLVLTDPPYGTTACKWDSVIPFEPMWEQLKRVIKPNGAIVLFGSEPFSSALRMSNIKNYKYDWIWEKDRPTNPLRAKKRPMNYREKIHVFYNRLPIYNPQMERRLERNKRPLPKRSVIRSSEVYGVTAILDGDNSGDMKYPSNIIKLPREQNNKHPTQKPVPLMEYLIRTYTNEGDTVLDFTSGSGTTGVAAANTGRKFIGVELDKDYFEIAQSRILNEWDLKELRND